MAAERPFIYDPSQQVAKNIEGVNRSVQNAWQPLIENKIRDYESISNDLANIDEIKRNLKGYHADILTSRLGTLQGDLAKTIEKNGTINVAARAKVKADIEQVKNLYIKSQQAGLVVEDVLSRAKENSAYMNDMSGFRDAILRKVRDPKAMLSGQSLDDELNNIYSDHLNVPSLVNNRVYETYVKRAAEKPVIWKDPVTGDEYEGSYKDVQGVVFNEKTGKLEINKSAVDGLGLSSLGDGEKYALGRNIGAAKALGSNVGDAAQQLFEESLLSGAALKMKRSLTKAERDKKEADAALAVYKASPEGIKAMQDEAASKIKAREVAAANSSANVGLRSESNQMTAEKFAYQKEQDKLTPDKQKEGKFFTETGGTGTVYLPLDTKEVKGKVGVTKKGNVFVTDKTGKYIKLTDAQLKEKLNGLPDNVKAEIKSIVNKQKGGGASQSSVPLQGNSKTDVGSFFKQ